MRPLARTVLIAVLAAAPFAALAAAQAATRAPAGVVNYTLPPEPQITLPPGDGAELAQANCAACHSLDYIETQPRGKGAQFWKDEVAKMVKVFGAPIEPADADAIAAYLGRTRG